MKCVLNDKLECTQEVNFDKYGITWCIIELLDSINANLKCLKKNEKERLKILKIIQVAQRGPLH